MNLLFIGCSHLSGSWDNPFQVDIQTGIIAGLAKEYPEHQFEVYALPGHGLFTFQTILTQLDSNYDRVIFVGDYNRLSIPASTSEPPLVSKYQTNNYSVHEYRVLPMYTIYPPNCLDPKPYQGDYRPLVTTAAIDYLDRKTRLMVDLLEEQLDIPSIEWYNIWIDMDRAGIHVESLWSHPTDRHFTAEGNRLALPFLRQRLQRLHIL